MNSGKSVTLKDTNPKLGVTHYVDENPTMPKLVSTDLVRLLDEAVKYILRIFFLFLFRGTTPRPKGSADFHGQYVKTTRRTNRKLLLKGLISSQVNNVQ